MTNPILYSRKIDGATFNFICQRTTNGRDGQPRLTVQVFESEPNCTDGVSVSYIKVPGARINKAGVYVMWYKYEGDNKQYREFIIDFMDAVHDKLREENN